MADPLHKEAGNEGRLEPGDDRSPERRIAAVAAQLAAAYGSATWETSGSPLAELIATVLSQHTSDLNPGHAYALLCASFPSWEAVAAAPLDEVADVIRMGGLANVKAQRIHQLLESIADRRGTYAIDFLATMQPEDAKGWLCSLPGVGPKTAACVVLFSLGMPVMPVDTHVFRVGRRLGLLDPSLTVERAHDAFDNLLAGNRDLTYSLHLNLIRHGRTVCKARTPVCRECVLARCCPSAASYLGEAVGLVEKWTSDLNQSTAPPAIASGTQGAAAG